MSWEKYALSHFIPAASASDLHFSSISFSLSVVEQIAIRRRPLHQQVHGHVSKLLSTQVASFTPKTRRRVRKMRPGIDRTTEEELTILVGFLQWCDSRSRPTQSGKATRKPLNISLFLQLKKECYIVLLFCHWLWWREMVLLRVRRNHVNVTCTLQQELPYLVQIAAI